MKNISFEIKEITFNYDERDGWSATDIDQNHYDILEATSFGGTTTSDIGIIMFNNPGLTESRLIDYFYGINDNSFIEVVANLIQEWRSKNTDTEFLKVE